MKKKKIKQAKPAAIGKNPEEMFMSGHSACPGCGAAVAMRHITNAVGKNTIISLGTGCMEVVSTSYPCTSWKIPTIHSAFENTAATAAGIEAALKSIGKEKEIKVVAIAGDGGTFDIGLQALSGMLERGHKVLYICYDNEAYMNTGIQRSGATPLHAATTTTPYLHKKHGKLEWKKNMPFIIASHNNNIYVATANIGYFADFDEKLRKAIQHLEKGPAYLQVLTPCVPGWKYNENMTIRLAKLATETKIYPLYEIEEGKIKISPITGAKPVESYLKEQGRFSHLSKEETNEIQARVDRDYEKLKKLSSLNEKIF